MAAITGNTGACAFNDGTTAQTLDTLITSWSMDVNIETHDVTAWAVSSNARNNIAGLYSVSGSFEGYLDDTTAISMTDITTPLAKGSNAELVLTAESGHTYTFDAVVSNISISVGIGELNRISATFISDGTLAIANA